MTPADPNAQQWIGAVRASHERLDTVVRRLDAETLVQPSYCDDWSIAQVLSHLGSGAEIMMSMIDAALGGPPGTNEQRQEVWAQWDGKEPQQQAADYQVADERLVNRWESLQPDELQRFEAELGPFKLSAADAAGMRLGEHVLHSWDIEVALEPNATLPPDAAGLLLTRLGFTAGFAGKADRWSGEPVRLRVNLTHPDARMLLEIGEKVQLTGPRPAGGAGEGDDGGEEGTTPGGSGAGDGELVMPAESFIRLVYGRLDPGHTPGAVSVTGPAGLDELRKVFPGF